MNAKQVMEKINNARLIWLTVTALFLGSGSMVGVVYANGKGLVKLAIQDTVNQIVDEKLIVIEEGFKKAIQEMQEEGERQQVELLSLLSEAMPEIKKVAQEKIEQRKASELLKKAIHQ